MIVRLYTVVMGTGTLDPYTRKERLILLGVATSRNGADQMLLRFPGAWIKKMVATPEGCDCDDGE